MTEHFRINFRLQFLFKSTESYSHQHIRCKFNTIIYGYTILYRVSDASFRIIKILKKIEKTKGDRFKIDLYPNIATQFEITVIDGADFLAIMLFLPWQLTNHKK